MSSATSCVSKTARNERKNSLRPWHWKKEENTNYCKLRTIDNFLRWGCKNRLADDEEKLFETRECNYFVVAYNLWTAMIHSAIQLVRTRFEVTVWTPIIDLVRDRSFTEKLFAVKQNFTSKKSRNKINKKTLRGVCQVPVFLWNISLLFYRSIVFLRFALKKSFK